MTILEMAIVLLVFHRAHRVHREPARSRDRSRCNSR
jgi:hypothetical protein